MREKKAESKNEAQKTEQAPAQEQAKADYKEQGEKLLDQMSMLSSYNTIQGKKLATGSVADSGNNNGNIEYTYDENGKYVWNEDTTEGTQVRVYTNIQSVIENLANLLGQIDSGIKIPEEYGIKGGLIDPWVPEPKLPQIVGNKINLGDKKISISEGFEPKIHPDGTVTLRKMGGDKVVEERKYDANLDRATTTKYLDGGEVKTWTYANNKVTSIVSEKDGRTTTVNYRENGKRESSVTQQNNSTTTCKYDENGNKISQTKVTKNDDGSTSTVEYKLDDTGAVVGYTSTRDYGFGLKQVVVKDGEEKTVEYYKGDTKLNKYADFKTALTEAREKTAANIEMANQIIERS